MASTDGSNEGKSQGDQYLLSRGCGPSIRLLAQHWLWKDQFGWNLHPKVKQAWSADKNSDGTEKPRTIADVATGNAIWIIEEAHLLPPGSKAYGFDISSAQFPAAYTVPSNTSLQVLDAKTSDLSDEFVNAFDFIHLRLLIGAVYKNDPRPILRNMIRMLKPGGILQWGEIMMDAKVLGEPDRGEDSTASRRIMTAVSKRMNPVPTKVEDLWVNHLASIFEECGLDAVETVTSGEPRREMWKFWADVLSTAMEEVVAASGIGQEHLTELANERDTGKYVWATHNIVIGSKPS